EHPPRRTYPRSSPSPLVTTSPSPAPSPPSTDNTSDLNRISPTAVPTPQEGARSSTSSNNIGLILLGAIGGPVLLLLLGVVIFCYRSGKVASVKPWATGLSGQLQRAFVTGVPKLKRSEIESACEDFSNVIGSSSVGTFYKGTLSGGVEIAVVSVAVSSKKEWSSNLEAQFRKKIDTLSKVSHKNFASLLGYCEEDQPFTRMMVFEYAPNGTLFEHIHIREAEHLDWLMRVRIAMGIAYSLDHMHQLSPPFAHKHLTSSSIYLTEDYAAKVSDFVFWDEAESQSNPPSNVYSFGVILFEMITGRLPYSAGSGSLDDWASDYLSWGQDVRELVDPTLKSYREDQLEEIGGVIRACVEPDPGRRPSMREVCERLREITGIGPDGAIPKLSPLWWAEIEIMSSDVS
ncbi:probable inactive receptor-like protein kinase at3g56050, partial [Phtheirospermum japonicum]